MAPKHKKAAAKKKNQKKSKERAALAAKQALEQKKIDESTADPKAKSKADRKKEKQRLKEQKQKEKIEAKRLKRQEKIKKLKERKKLAEAEGKKKYTKSRPEFVEKLLLDETNNTVKKKKKVKKDKAAQRDTAQDAAKSKNTKNSKTQNRKQARQRPGEEAAEVILPVEEPRKKAVRPAEVACESAQEIVIAPEVPDEYRTAALVYDDAPSTPKTLKTKTKNKSRKAKKSRAATTKTACVNRRLLLLKKLPKRARKPAVAAVAFLFALPLLVVIGSELRMRLTVPEGVVTQYLGMRASPVDAREIELELDEQLSLARRTRAGGDNRAFKFFAANKSVVVGEWYEPIAFGLGNAQNNTCDMVFMILDKDGNYVYRSLGIAPGQYLPSVKLFRPLDYGEYKFTLIVAGYEPDKVNPETEVPDTYKLIGVQYTKLKLVVGIEQETTAP